MKTNLLLFLLLIPIIAFSQSSPTNKKNKPLLVGKKNYSLDKLNTSTCEELIHYRDVELVVQFDNATKKYTDKYKLNNSAIDDMQKLKRELLNERGWDELMPIGTAISARGLTIAKIARVIKSYCDLILGLTEMLPAGNLGVTTIKQVRLTADQTYKLIKVGKDFKEIVEGNLEKVAVKNVLDKMSVAGMAANIALEFYENLNALTKIPEEHAKLKNEVARILNLLENAVYTYQQDLEKTKANLDDIIGIEQGITKYLNENCKEEDAIDKTLLEELAKQTTQPKINPTQTGISYFIFLTADISVAPQKSLFSNLQTPKHLHVISKPIWYTQNQTDENNVKETFLRAIEKRLQNLDKDFYKNFSRNNYEAVGYINTNFRESTPLLNNQQCQEALVNYKIIILDVDKNAEFIQL